MNCTILFRFEANKQLGMGHWFRVQMLASACDGNNILFATSEKTIDFLHIEHDIRVRKITCEEDLLQIINTEQVDCIVNDILNTNHEYIESLKRKTNARVVNLEDEGDGGAFADAVINELYENGQGGLNYYYGHRYCCLDPTIQSYQPNPFQSEIKKGVVLFGCTDPLNLSVKTVRAIQNLNYNRDLDIDVIAGPGYEHVDELETMIKDSKRKDVKIKIHQNVDIKGYMKQADFGISSQGRTIFELAYFRVPTIIMAQNEREMLHTFASEQHGFLNLGLGSEVTDDKLEEAIWLVLTKDEYRKNMYNKMSQLNLSNGIHEVLKLLI